MTLSQSHSCWLPKIDRTSVSVRPMGKSIIRQSGQYYLRPGLWRISPVHLTLAFLEHETE